MRVNSLALRLFLWATGWTVVILIVTGIVLSTLYRNAVERAFDRRLDVYLRTLVADVASPEEGTDKFPQSIGEPLFDLPLSGWYWQVTRLDTAKPEVHSSRSLWDSNFPRLADGGQGAAGLRRIPAGLCAGSGGRAAAPGRAHHRSRRRWPLSGRRCRRRHRDRRRDAQLRPRHRCDLRRTRHRAASDDGVAGALRSLAVEAHLREPGGDPLGPRRAAAGRISGRDRAACAGNQCADRRQSRDRRARAHPCRQSRARAEDAAFRYRQRGGRARGRSLGAEGARADRHHARSGRAPARARAACRPLDRGRRADRRIAGRHRARPHDGEAPSRTRHRHRRRRAGAGALSAANSTTSRR